MATYAGRCPFCGEGLDRVAYRQPTIEYGHAYLLFGARHIEYDTDDSESTDSPEFYCPHCDGVFDSEEEVMRALQDDGIVEPPDPDDPTIVVVDEWSN